MVTTRLGLATLAALLGISPGCNLILGTTPPLPFGTGGCEVGSTSWPTPCGSAEQTHWSPAATHVYDTSTCSGGESYVTDELTGLAWQMPPSTDIFKWDDARDHCEGLSWGGLQGYRLPTLAELASLTRYDQAAPALDSGAFPGVTGDYWTGTAAPGSGDSMFVVSHGNGSIDSNTKIGTAGAWCVRDLKPAPDTACERYSLTDGGQSVRDGETGLVWQRSATQNGMVDWAHAPQACGSVKIGGYTWRVPEVSELVSLIYVTGDSPSGLDPKFFLSDEPVGYFWTATADVSSSQNAWTVNTEQPAAASVGVKSDATNVRCVR